MAYAISDIIISLKRSYHFMPVLGLAVRRIRDAFGTPPTCYSVIISLIPRNGNSADSTSSFYYKRHRYLFWLRRDFPRVTRVRDYARAVLFDRRGLYLPTTTVKYRLPVLLLPTDGISFRNAWTYLAWLCRAVFHHCLFTTIYVRLRAGLLLHSV